MGLSYGIAASCWALLFLADQTTGFVPELRTRIAKSTPTTILKVAVVPNLDGEIDSRSFILSREEVKPLVTLGKDDNEKIANPFGLLCAVVSVITCPVWLLSMKSGV